MATAITETGQSERTGIILAIAHTLLMAAAATALPAVAGAPVECSLRRPSICAEHDADRIEVSG